MKTVKDYKQLGLVFIQGDYINTHEGKKQSPLNRYGVGYCNDSRSNDDKFAVEFAWRNNDGVKPEYKGQIEAYLNNAIEISGIYADRQLWSIGYLNSVAKWRPVVMQSESSTVSSKEDKPMKPVYTAEMHARNELPPVDSKVKVCIKEAGFYVDEQDVKFEGKAVTVKAAFSNTESEKIVAVENEDGNCYCYIIECIKPIIKTIKVNGFDVPAPMSEAPMIDGGYFTPQTGFEVFYCENKWRSDVYDHRFLSRGLVHATKSAAIAHAKAMLGINPNPANGAK